MNALTFVIIGPERAVSPAERAVARGYRARIAFQAPTQSAAMACPSQHPSPARSAARNNILAASLGHWLLVSLVDALASGEVEHHAGQAAGALGFGEHSCVCELGQSV
jgi:hypothetical protein